MYTQEQIDELKQKIQPIISNRNLGTPEYVKQMGEVKKFLERFTGDNVFREEFLKNPQATVEQYGLPIDPEEIRLLWDFEAATSHDPTTEPVPLPVMRYRALW